MQFPQISLEAARVNAGYTQKDAAKCLGIDPTTLGKYEHGFSIPKWDMVQKMCKLYNFPSDFIFFKERIA